MNLHKAIIEVDFSTILPDFSPCDSPIEDRLYYDIQKCLSPDAVISRQFECPTPIGTFRLDFMVVAGTGRLIGIECDGKGFHDAVRDDVRDRAILKAGHVNRIYRLRGRDIVFHLHDALALMAAQEPAIFSERGRNILSALATHPNEHTDEKPFHAADGFGQAIRRYHWVYSEDDIYTAEDDADHLLLPTVLCWTDKPSNPN